jgi:hypothetical protein
VFRFPFRASGDLRDPPRFAQTGRFRTAFAGGLAAFPSRLAGFFRREFVGGAFRVRGFSPQARNLALPCTVHRGEPSVARPLLRHENLLCHQVGVAVDADGGATRGPTVLLFFTWLFPGESDAFSRLVSPCGVKRDGGE